MGSISKHPSRANHSFCSKETNHVHMHLSKEHGGDSTEDTNDAHRGDVRECAVAAVAGATSGGSIATRTDDTDNYD